LDASTQYCWGDALDAAFFSASKALASPLAIASMIEGAVASYWGWAAALLASKDDKARRKPKREIFIIALLLDSALGRFRQR